MCYPERKKYPGVGVFESNFRKSAINCGFLKVKASPCVILSGASRSATQRSRNPSEAQGDRFAVGSQGEALKISVRFYHASYFCFALRKPLRDPAARSALRALRVRLRFGRFATSPPLRMTHRGVFSRVTGDGAWLRCTTPEHGTKTNRAV